MRPKVHVRLLNRSSFSVEFSREDGESIRIRVELPVPILAALAATAAAPKIGGQTVLAGTKVFINDRTVDVGAILTAMLACRSLLAAARVGRRALVSRLLKAGAERALHDLLHDGKAARWLLRQLDRTKELPPKGDE